MSLAAERARIEAAEATFLTTSIGSFMAGRCSAMPGITLLDVFERGETITYAEAERRTNRIGHALLHLGIGRGDRVAVMLPNRVDYPLIWLALAKIGAVHVPVNTRYTPREVAYLLENSGTKLAITEAGFLEVFPAPGPVVLDIDGAFQAAVEAAADTPCLDPAVGPDDLMNIQYTSGTTGFPKGCRLSHDYWMVLAQSALVWDATTPKRLLTAQPFFYMDPQWHLLKAMLAGGTLVMAPGLSSSRFIGWVKQHRIEWCQFPILMTRQPPAPDDAHTALRQVATFGWDGETARSFQRRFGVPAREGFGMTEIGLGTFMPAGLDAMSESASVGIAGPFRETTIRDEHGQRVPPGTRGELWVRGRSIFGGYWNRPDADADAFRPAEDRGPPWFRTGDLFEADAEGFHWLVGRLKDMIRRSSENIAAREVEAVVRELDAVEDCAAVPVPDAMRGEEVKIYVQLKDGVARSALSPEAIVAHCRTRLAAFKVPRFVAYRDEFPRTVSNKIEKRILIQGVDDLRADSWDADAYTMSGTSRPSRSARTAC